MFNLNDKTYSEAPKKMSILTAKKILDETLAYCIIKKQLYFDITLHGGEPLLWGEKNFRDFFEHYENLRPEFECHNIKVTFGLQTNGYVINYNILDILQKYNVTFGVSLDGPEEYHDEYRVNHSGNKSYKKIIKNINDIITKGYSNLLGGFLTVINTKIEPKKYFEWVLSLPITRVEVLYPIDFNYNNLPWDYHNTTKEEYLQMPLIGKWLCELYILWYKYDNPNVVIAKFRETIAVILGEKSHGDQMVNDELGLIVIDTDGKIEYHDYFRGFKDGIIKTPYNLYKQTFLALEKDLIFNKLFNLKKFLPNACKNCNINHLCGGGFLAGRLKENLNDVGINKSVLCNDHYEYYFYVIKQIFTELGITRNFEMDYQPPTFVLEKS